LTIRDLEEEVRAQLRVRAARHGRSMEAEVRAILREALGKSRASDRLGTRIHQRFVAVGGLEAEQPRRGERPRAPNLAE